MLEKLIVVVEEPSMEAALECLLPKMIEDVNFQIIRFQCKTDLLKQLPCRLKGYKKWIPSNWVIVVLVDRDDADCHELKQQLENIAAQGGFTTKTHAGAGKPFQVVNRIVIEELEAWFFGDWVAVKTAYPKVPENIHKKAKYRNPDGILGGTWEAFERILKKSNYIDKAGLRKIENAREIAQYMEPSRNQSGSFKAFQAAIFAAMGRI